MRLRKALASVTLVVLALVAVIVTPTTAAAGTRTSSTTTGRVTSAEVTSGQVTVSVDALAPEVVTSGQDLTISGTIANGSGETISGASLVIEVQERTDLTVSSLSSWVSGQSSTRLRTVATQAVATDLAPGATTTFSVTVAADALPFTDGSQWGPRGVSVSLTRAGTPLAQHRTAVIWSDAATVDPTGITAVVPVTASADELALISSTSATDPATGASPSPSTQASATETTGTTPATPGSSATEDEADDALTAVRERVTALLDLAQDGVVLAVDPALLQALGVDTGTTSSGSGATAGPTDATTTPTSTTTSSPTETSDPALELRSALEHALSTGDVIALPWGDADIAALAHLGRSDLITETTNRTAAATTLAAARSDVAWPASTTLDAATLSALPTTTSLVVAPVGTMEVIQALTYTPDGLTTYGSRTLLLPDSGLSLALAGTLVARDADSGSTVTTSLSDLDARQLLRAQTAIVTRQLPNLGRDLVVVLDRQDAATLSPATIAGRLEALLDSSWTAPRDLATLTARSQDDVARTDVPASVTEADELSASQAERASAISATLSSLATALSDAPAVLGDSQDLECTVASATWRTQPAGREALLASAAAVPGTIRRALTAAPSSTINVINSEAHIPVRIISSLDQAVTLTVHLSPSSTRLQATQDVQVTVPARGETTATVPVKAVGSGDVEVEIGCLSPSGEQVGTTSTMHMRVRADWETVGTTVIGAVLMLLLVVGIIRTVRRGRRATPVQDH